MAFPLIKILKAVIQKINKEQEKEHTEEQGKELYDKVLQKDWGYNNGQSVDIRNIPRLSFEQNG